MMTEEFYTLRNVMAKEQTVIKFENGASDHNRHPRFRPAFVEFPSNLKSALRHANNEALKKLIEQKSPATQDPLLPIMMQEALRLHFQVEELLATLPGDYDKRQLKQLGLIESSPELNRTAE